MLKKISLIILLSLTIYNLLKSEYKFVLSGGAGIGKTTIINFLKQNGYQTIPEAWTFLFNEAKKNNDFKYFDYNVEFFKKLMETQLIFEKSFDKNKYGFFDRSVVDVIAFAHYHNIKLPQSMIDILKDYKYDLIFFLDPLPKEFYNKNELCSYEDSLKIHSYLKQFYKNIGYEIIDVPFDNHEKRIEFILNHISSKTKALKNN